MNTTWVTKQIIPALPGWKAIYFNPETPLIVEVVGWALQEEHSVNSRGDILKHEEDLFAPETRVVACEVTGGLCEWDEVGACNFWRVVGPSDAWTMEEYNSANAQFQEKKRQRAAAVRTEPAGEGSKTAEQKKA